MREHLSIAGQASQSRGRHHTGLVTDYGWLSHQIHCIACRAFFLLHFLDFLLQVFFIVLVLDVDQVEKGTLLAIEFELLLNFPRAVVFIVLVIVIISLNVKDTGPVGRCFQRAAATSAAVHEELLGRSLQGGDLIGIHLNALANSQGCLLSGLQPIPLWVLSVWLIADRHPLIFFGISKHTAAILEE